MGPGLHPRGRGEGRASFPLLLLRRGKPALACPCLPKGTCLVTARKATCPKTPNPSLLFKTTHGEASRKSLLIHRLSLQRRLESPGHFQGRATAASPPLSRLILFTQAREGRLVCLRTLNFTPPYCQEIGLELGLEGTGSLASNLCERMTSDRHPFPAPPPAPMLWYCTHTHTQIRISAGVHEVGKAPRLTETASNPPSE